MLIITDYKEDYTLDCQIYICYTSALSYIMECMNEH